MLDRYRGGEISTAGDGFLASFDGAGRAVEAAIAIRDRTIADSLSVRIGVHSGEVELAGDDLRGLTVHEASRIAGNGWLHFEPRGPFQLEGFDGPRTLFAVVQSSSPGQ